MSRERRNIGTKYAGFDQYLIALNFRLDEAERVSNNEGLSFGEKKEEIEKLLRGFKDGRPRDPKVGEVFDRNNLSDSQRGLLIDYLRRMNNVLDDLVLDDYRKTSGLMERINEDGSEKITLARAIRNFGQRTYNNYFSYWEFKAYTVSTTLSGLFIGSEYDRPLIGTLAGFLFAPATIKTVRWIFKDRNTKK